MMIRVAYQDEDAHRLDAEEWDGETISALSEVAGLVGQARSWLTRRAARAIT